jgi:prolyl-tRNA synthetase
MATKKKKEAEQEAQGQAAQSDAQSSKQQAAQQTHDTQPAAEQEARFVEDLADMDDFAQWYQAVVHKADLADESPVRGCMIIKPYGYALWEAIQRGVDERIKATGHENLYFPLFIPMSFLQKEAEHVEGFAPELAVVTIGGGEELAEPLAVRPTSETIIGHTYARWVQSYRDLPLLYNQWANVVRWEKRTRLFLRTSEFLWQEGHTVHRTEDEAEEETLKILNEVYVDFAEKDLAIPMLKGRKTESEKFAGALRSYSMEAMMGDGKALQAGTSHNLGQNFARAFDIQFLDADGTRKFAWTTSWGVSSRLIGGVIMVHGDESGLKMPPRIAPIQVVIVPIWRKDEERAVVAEAVAAVERELRAAGLRVKSDWREQTPGYKFNDWELRGVPLRLELGPKDVQKDQAVLVRRDTRAKEFVPRAGLAARAGELLGEIQQALFDAALAFRQRRTYQAKDFAELAARMADRANLGFVEAWWCGDAQCETEIKARTQATIRCLPFERPTTASEGVCVFCGQPAREWAVFAKAY